MCSLGSHWIDHCLTDRASTISAPCPDNHYLPNNNISHSCQASLYYSRNSSSKTVVVVNVAVFVVCVLVVVVVVVASLRNIGSGMMGTRITRTRYRPVLENFWR
ncbi:hypothetical protein DPMN_179931 [Dreissena polymorpha]|uniref:Uncharacterized protein n=1 Tax=Dreissena polymorpha TaxID=45954 RepID=A0A9D4EI59_DREPO|nr:hypothetical protein DPMN_179931 [Dreissena polymorpha]